MSDGADDPGKIIRQALRAQVGGPKLPARDGAGGDPGGDSGRTAGDTGVDIGSAAVGRLGRLTVAQVLLIAAIVGLVIGMAAGFVVLAVR